MPKNFLKVFPLLVTVSSKELRNYQLVVLKCGIECAQAAALVVKSLHALF